MAENEILDVGSRKHYRGWLAVVGDPTVSPEKAADRLLEDLLLTLKKKLSAEPLLTILKACGSDQMALQNAVMAFKDLALAKWVEQAYKITGSKNVAVIAAKIAELIVDGVQDRASRFAMKSDLKIDQKRQIALERATIVRLEGAKFDIENLLVRSLRAEKLGKIRRLPRASQTAKTLVTRSLNPKANLSLRNSQDVR